MFWLFMRAKSVNRDFGDECFDEEKCDQRLLGKEDL